MTNINTNINNRSSEFLRKTSATNGFDEYSSSDNNRISQNHGNEEKQEDKKTAMYKWFGEEELGTTLTNKCTLKDTLCKEWECVVCQTIHKERITWEGINKGQQEAVQQVQEWTNKKKLSSTKDTTRNTLSRQ